MTKRKTPEKLAMMAEGGQRLGRILSRLLEEARPGVKLVTLDQRASSLIAESGGTPSFQTVKGYHWATCLCVNEVVVHGVPSQYVLKEGDVLTIDVGMLYAGFHTDTAWTKIVHGSSSPVDRKKEIFLKTGKVALADAIAVAKVGNHVGHISRAIAEVIGGAGFSIVRSLVGHGVGRQLHESPQVPGFLEGKIENTPKLEVGMTIAIEAIYAMGKGAVVYDNKDGWSVATADGSLSAVFEHTIAVTAREPRILTKGKQ